jgi:hypothetical protein
MSRPRRPIRLSAAVALAALALGATGCATSTGPAYVTVPGASYDVAFDAAVEAARQVGMPALVRDRRAGVIETDTRIAGSILEPWRTDNESLSQAFENTIAFQRRRARFEFVPAGFVEPADIDPDGPLTGVDLASGDAPRFDLTRGGGDLELRVWVFIERADVPGVRRSTWARGLTTRTRREGDDRNELWGGGSDPTWTPVDRDAAFEQRLLASVERQLASSAAP